MPRFTAMKQPKALARLTSLDQRLSGWVIGVMRMVVGVLWLVGMLPWFRGHSLFWLGLVSNLLLLPSVVACLRLGFPAPLGALVAVLYSGVWWMIVKSRIDGV